MNEQDQRIRREAMRLDALDGIGDPDMTGRVAWRASDGDSIWTAAIMPMGGYDRLSMAYEAGDTLIHRLTWHPQRAAWTLRRSYTARHEPGGDRTHETLDTIAKWEQGATPTSHAPASQPLPHDGNGPHPIMGWQAATEQAERITRTLASADEARAMLMQRRLDQAGRPVSWIVEDYGIGGMGLYLVEWHIDDHIAGSYRVTRADWDPDTRAMRDFAHSETISCHINADDPAALGAQARQAIDLMRAHLDQTYGAPEGMRHANTRAGTTTSPTDRPLLDLDDGRTVPDWDSAVERTALPIAMTGAPRTAREPARPDVPMSSTASGRPAMSVPARLVHPYTRHGRDGRGWNKMVVRLPEHIMIDGSRLGGWNLDRFMSPRQQQAHARGEAVTITFRSGEQVELWRGKGSQRRARTIDANTLCEAIHQTLQAKPAPSRTGGEPDKQPPAEERMAVARERLTRLETEQPDLCARAADLCMDAVEHDWPRIARLQERLIGHMNDGTWRDDLALKAARRTIGAIAGDNQAWGRAERDTAALMLLDHLTRADTTPPQAGMTIPSPRASDTTTQTNAATADTTPSPKREDIETDTDGRQRPMPFRTLINRLFTHETGQRDGRAGRAR